MMIGSDGFEFAEKLRVDYCYDLSELSNFKLFILAYKNIIYLI